MTETRPAPDLAEQFAAAIEWWRDAGVDRDYADDATSWLREPEGVDPASDTQPARHHPAADQTPAPAKLMAQMGGDASGWPATIAAFRDYWLSEPSLDSGGLNPRIPPRGPQGAALMVLVAEPEEQDRDNLLSGPHGALLANMLDAMRFAPDLTYLASALPRHTPMPDWGGLAARGLGRIVAHHIALASPKRLLVLGQSILPLLQNSMAQKPDGFREFAHETLKVPTMAAPGLAHLLRRGAARESFWRDWLNWTDGSDE